MRVEPPVADASLAYLECVTPYVTIYPSHTAILNAIIFKCGLPVSRWEDGLQE